MIYGIGTDIVAIKRIVRFEDKNMLFALSKKILKSEEIEIVPKLKEEQIIFLAKRFAAKEALSKALGVGIGQSFSFQDVSITHDSNGKPQFEASGKLKDWLTKENLSLFLSLSDEKEYVVAVVVVEKN